VIWRPEPARRVTALGQNRPRRARAGEPPEARVAVCWARTAGCKNARLPMQTGCARLTYRGKEERLGTTRPQLSHAFVGPWTFAWA
jgi:hypothetical protein